MTEINIVFRKPPLLLFETLDTDDVPPSNVLTLRIQPDEGIRLTFDAKRPGPSVNIERVAMDFSYREYFGGPILRGRVRASAAGRHPGDRTLFIRRDETELAWDRVTRILDGWRLRKKQAAKEAGKDHLGCPSMRPVRGGRWKQTSYVSKEDDRYWRNPPSASRVG